MEQFKELDPPTENDYLNELKKSEFAETSKHGIHTLRNLQSALHSHMVVAENKGWTEESIHEYKLARQTLRLFGNGKIKKEGEFGGFVWVKDGLPYDKDILLSPDER